ncbi:hypothetical protein SUS17_867 [Sphingomonas sp. S17]|jgi:hypothetical protein|uniref:Uncharacterized protein n=3 Tax=Pseudomonadota TaxID=1224 RepID=A0A411LGV5_SPHPI|nr:MULTISPECIES: hypothetical protein [Sphingomonas]MDG6746388.1 hypothetical protein [Staphylococcus aureus]EGI56322.1 hypothetical protein SUS17_867 [Sphingomonas sp. S17]MBQ1481470.1 hypothetical protein [Sphingomonas sp.]MCM3677702.1 hypothetical protein [Sphingomonas paucimobilis]MDG5972329.1 hypothetical protein [Sphingomonas paucimobilis]
MNKLAMAMGGGIALALVAVATHPSPAPAQGAPDTRYALSRPAARGMDGAKPIDRSAPQARDARIGNLLVTPE